MIKVFTEQEPNDTLSSNDNDVLKVYDGVRYVQFNYPIIFGDKTVEDFNIINDEQELIKSIIQQNYYLYADNG